MTNPTDTWRATFAASGISTSERLSQTQEALAASQADLTAMQARYEEASAEAADWRKQADHWLTKLRDTARDLAAANYANRRLKAELDSALGRLNQQRNQGGEPRG